jgi:hypothetical protein
MRDGRDQGPVIRLESGPRAGAQFYEEDFLERIRAAQRMGRTTVEGPGWPLGCQRPIAGLLWTWRGVNCHPRPLDDT